MKYVRDRRLKLILKEVFPGRYSALDVINSSWCTDPLKYLGFLQREPDGFSAVYNVPFCVKSGKSSLPFPIPGNSSLVPRWEVEHRSS